MTQISQPSYYGRAVQLKENIAQFSIQVCPLDTRKGFGILRSTHHRKDAKIADRENFWGGWRKRLAALRKVPPVLRIVLQSSPLVVSVRISFLSDQLAHIPCGRVNYETHH